MATISRRESLAMALGMAMAAAMPVRSDPEEDRTSLNSLAGRKGMRFGSAVGDGAAGSFNEPNYAAVLVAECGLVVPENEL